MRGVVKPSPVVRGSAPDKRPRWRPSSSLTLVVEILRCIAALCCARQGCVKRGFAPGRGKLVLAVKPVSKIHTCCSKVVHGNAMYGPAKPSRATQRMNHKLVCHHTSCQCPKVNHQRLSSKHLAKQRSAMRSRASLSSAQSCHGRATSALAIFFVTGVTRRLFSVS